MTTFFPPEFYRSLFEALENTSFLLQIDEKGMSRPVSCSKKYAALLECTQEEFCRMETEKPLCTIFPEDRAAFAEVFRTGVVPESGNHITVRAVTQKSGQLLWVNICFALFSYEDKRYCYCNCYDFTHIKENEAQLAALYQSLHADLMDASEDILAVLRVNLTTGLIEQCGGWDIRAADFKESEYTAALKERAAFYPDEADRECLLTRFSRENLMKCFERGENTLSSVLYMHRPGRGACYVQITATMTRQPLSGALIAFLSEKLCNDAMVWETLRKKIFAGQYDMVASLLNGEYRTVIAGREKGGLMPEQEQGSYEAYIRESVISAVDGEEQERKALQEALSVERVEQALRSGHEPYTVHLRCRVQGALRYQRFSFYAADLAHGFYVMLKSDDTEAHREQLQSNEQLKNALQVANQASVAKTAFLSRMSHEIRTPMNSIIGLDTIALQEPGLTDAVRGHLERIGSSARYLLSLINDVLDMSRIESGKMVLKPEEFSFKEFLDHINTMFYSQCEEKKLKYDCLLHDKVAEYYIGDAGKLQQVLMNILGNAVKFTDSGGMVCLHVERINGTQQQTTLRFTVEDTGIGIDKDYLPYLFDPFSQEDSGNTNIYGGSGLGLAICKYIVTLMNGRIDVVSEKGMGSVFTVDVTLRNARSTEHAEEEIIPSKMRVLVIDDEETACRHAQIELQEAGFACQTAMTLEEVLRVVHVAHGRGEDFDLVLVDLRMPEHDGISVTREIRRIIGNAVTIIILTAYNWEDVEQEALAAGVDAFMRKPLFSESLLREFRHAMQKKKAKLQKGKKPVELKGSRILVAEDVEINAEIVKRLLMMRGMEVTVAENGQIALERFSQSAEGEYQAILMDVRMPVMDGLTSASEIRRLTRKDARRIPIIAMTANAFDEDVQRSLQAGMDAHLSKPVDPEKLYETLEKFITEGREQL